MKIYTRTGDDGTTSLFSGQRVRKNASAVAAYGDADELNSFLGWARVVCTIPELDEFLMQIQHDLHRLCSDLATSLDSKKKIDRLDALRSKQLEQWMDQMESELPALKNFILPGGSELSARLHICRTVCRRAERSLLNHADHESINTETIVYLNRLSDFFFMAARFANKRSGNSDVLWDQSR